MAQQQSWSAENWLWRSRDFAATARQNVSDKSFGQDKGLEHSSEGLNSGSPTTSGDQVSRGLARPSASAVCQVEGCSSDLAGLKEYHNRYKICEFHLKIPCITREGTQQRFCQQCGRFHNIGEFDGDKRSCRARLQRHNARRRKAGSEPAKVGKRATSKHVRDLGPSRSNSPVSDDAKAASGLPEAAAQPQPHPLLQPHTQSQRQSQPQSHSPQQPQPYQQTWPQVEVHIPQSAWSSCAMNTSTALDNAFAAFLKQENGQASMPGTSAYHPDGGQTSPLTQQVLHPLPACAAQRDFAAAYHLQ